MTTGATGAYSGCPGRVIIDVRLQPDNISMHRQATNMNGAISILRNISNNPCFIRVGAGLPANLSLSGIMNGAISILSNIRNDPCFILVGAGLPANCISRQVRGHAPGQLLGASASPSARSYSFLCTTRCCSQTRASARRWKWPWNSFRRHAGFLSCSPAPRQYSR